MGIIFNFRDLLVWQRGHKLVLGIYNLTTKFPVSEQFGLTNQLRRASVSITSNIAEGFSRKSIKEKLQFYYMAHGSLSEVENQVQIAKDVGYVDEKEYENIANLCLEVGKLLNSLINKTTLRK